MNSFINGTSENDTMNNNGECSKLPESSYPFVLFTIFAVEIPSVSLNVLLLYLSYGNTFIKGTYKISFSWLALCDLAFSLTTLLQAVPSYFYNGQCFLLDYKLI